MNFHSKTYTLTTRPYYDNINQCYQNIIVINRYPEGPLRKITRRIQFHRLSPFQEPSSCNPIQNCGLALQSLKIYGYDFPSYKTCQTGCGCFMTPDEIPDLFSFLLSSGYQIDTSITNMMNKSDVRLSDSRIICFIRYEGNISL